MYFDGFDRYIVKFIMEKMKTRKVILDVDTGSDDAIAIMCASEG